MKWWHLLFGVLITAVVLGMILTPLYAQGPVEVPDLRINDPDGVLSPEERAVLEDLARQQDGINKAVFERLRGHSH